MFPQQILDHLPNYGIVILVGMLIVKEITGTVASIASGFAAGQKFPAWVQDRIERRVRRRESREDARVLRIVTPMLDEIRNSQQTIAKQVKPNGGQTDSLHDIATRTEHRLAKHEEQDDRRFASVEHRLTRQEAWYVDMEHREDRHEAEHEQMEKGVAAFVAWAGSRVSGGPETAS